MAGDPERSGGAVALRRGERRDLRDLTAARQLLVWGSGVAERGHVAFAMLGVDRKGRLVGRQVVACSAQRHVRPGGVRMVGGDGAAAFHVDLDDLPAGVEQLVLVAHLVGSSASDLVLARWGLVVAGVEVAHHVLSPDELDGERALVLGQLYRRESWRVAVVGQGYRSGVEPLLHQLGADGARDLFAEDEPVPDAPPLGDRAPAAGPRLPGEPAAPIVLTNPWRAELSDRLATEAPALFDLARLAGVSLERHGLVGHAAKVALCLDISLSMDGLFRSGKIQRFAEKILALGTLFDDDGDIDVFLFGLHAHDVGAMNLDNWQGFVEGLRGRYPLEAGTYYGKAMAEIRRHYFGGAVDRDGPLRADYPVYVMFVTDGMTADQEVATDELRASSFEPIFWQFMAIGKITPTEAPRPGPRRRRRKGTLPEFTHDFSFLAQLDDLPDRYVDNAAFFSVEDPEHESTEQLYERMMVEYPGWVRLAPSLGLLDPTTFLDPTSEGAGVAERA